MIQCNSWGPCLGRVLRQVKFTWSEGDSYDLMQVLGSLLK